MLHGLQRNMLRRWFKWRRPFASSLANATRPCRYGAGHAGLPFFRFPQKGNGAPGGRQGVCEAPLGEPLRSGRPHALRGRAPVLRGPAAPPRRSIHDTHCRRAGLAPHRVSLEMTRASLQGAGNVRCKKRVGIKISAKKIPLTAARLNKGSKNLTICTSLRGPRAQRSGTKQSRVLK